MLLYETLADELSEMIAAGQLQAGVRLPSVRSLAQQRSLSISTVVQALRTLESRGLVEARPQSGYYVRGRDLKLVEPALHAAPAKAVPVGVTKRLIAVLAANEAPGVVPFGSALPVAELLPAPQLNRLYASIARRKPRLLAGSSHAGLNEPALVSAIVRRSLEWGGAIRAAEIVVTNSCTEAMALCLRSCTKPGDTVAVESPTYYVMLQLLESMGLHALEIPTHPRTGISIEALELATRHGSVAACLLIPNGGNPLGSVMPDHHKQAIANLLSERNIGLIEDDIYGDICFGKVRPRPIYAFDPSGNVMLCTSFSKTLSPSLRLGYVAGGRRSNEILLQKTVNSGKTNPLTQLVVAEFIEGRGYDVHLRTLRRRIAEQVARTRDAIARHFPAGTRVTDPLGGFVLWLELPQAVDATELHRRAIEAKIAFVPGEMFSTGGQYRNCLRIACVQPWSEKSENALARLGELAAAELNKTAAA